MLKTGAGLMDNTKVNENLTGWVIEEGWRISRQFMQEIVEELNLQDKLPINLLLASRNLALKWLEFARRN